MPSVCYIDKLVFLFLVHTNFLQNFSFFHEPQHAVPILLENIVLYAV